MLTIGPWQAGPRPDRLTRSDTIEGEVAMIGALLMRGGITRAFQAMSRKDHEAVLRLVHPNVVLEYPGRTPMGGRFVGRDAYEAWLRRWFEHMFTIDFTVRHVALENPWALGLTNTAMIEWELQQTAHDGRSTTLTGSTVCEFRSGKLVAQRIYETDPLAHELLWQPVEARRAA
jgi:ketosteroid isomerase-like protein